MRQFTDAPIYWCANLLVHQFIGAQIYGCTNLLMRQFTDAPIYWCANLLMRQFTDAPIYWYANLLVHQFTDAPITILTGHLTHIVTTVHLAMEIHHSPWGSFDIVIYCHKCFLQVKCHMWGKTFSSPIALEQDCKLTGHVICNSLTARADYWILCRWDGQRAFLSSGITLYNWHLHYRLWLVLFWFCVFLFLCHPSFCNEIDLGSTF